MAGQSGRKRKTAPKRKASAKTAAQKKADADARFRRLKMAAVLKTIRGGCSVTTACAVNRISKTTLYNWIKADADFAEAVEHARLEPVKGVERSMFRRAKSKNEAGAQRASEFILTNKLPDEYKDIKEHRLGGQVSVDRVQVLKNLVEGAESGEADG